jgi:hypothetical protein
MKRMKLGRKAIKTDSRTLRLADYLPAVLPTPPAIVNWTKGITSWGEMLNNSLGDCTIAALGHAIQVWTANTTSEATVSDPIILSAYEKWCGYNPEDSSTDAGGIELDVLTDFKRDGLGDHSLLAFVSARVGNVTEIKQAIELFGGIYVGMDFPNVAFNQNVWTVVADDGGSAGGHAVFIAGYNAAGPVAITWGELRQMTWAFWAKYFDEAHVLLSPDWIAQKVPAGRFDLDTLKSDLASIK